MKFTGKLLPHHGMYTRREGKPVEGLPDERDMWPIEIVPEDNITDQMRRIRNQAKVSSMHPAAGRVASAWALDTVEQRQMQDEYMEAVVEGFEQDAKDLINSRTLIPLFQDPRVSWTEARAIQGAARERIRRGEHAFYPRVTERDWVEELGIGTEYNMRFAEAQHMRDMLAIPSGQKRMYEMLMDEDNLMVHEGMRLRSDPDTERVRAGMAVEDYSDRRLQVRAANIARRLGKKWRNKIVQNKINAAMERITLRGKKRKAPRVPLWEGEEFTPEQLAFIDTAERRTRNFRRDRQAALLNR